MPPSFYKVLHGTQTNYLCCSKQAHVSNSAVKCTTILVWNLKLVNKYSNSCLFSVGENVIYHTQLYFSQNHMHDTRKNNPIAQINSHMWQKWATIAQIAHKGCSDVIEKDLNAQCILGWDLGLFWQHNEGPTQYITCIFLCIGVHSFNRNSCSFSSCQNGGSSKPSSSINNSQPVTTPVPGILGDYGFSANQSGNLSISSACTSLSCSSGSQWLCLFTFRVSECFFSSSVTVHLSIWQCFHVHVVGESVYKKQRNLSRIMSRGKTSDCSGLARDWQLCYRL